MRRLLPTAFLAALLPAAVVAQDAMAPAATATIIDAEGNEIGEAQFHEFASGGVHIVLTAEGIPAGVHGVHVHETGDCATPDFQSAGGHIAGDAQHGFDSPEGVHPGDLPNAHVQDDEVLAVEYVNDRLVMDESMMLDEDGSAILIHETADDYRTDPSGESGGRIACGVIEPAEAG